MVDVSASVSFTTVLFYFIYFFNLNRIIVFLDTFLLVFFSCVQKFRFQIFLILVFVTVKHIVQTYGGGLDTRSDVRFAELKKRNGNYVILFLFKKIRLILADFNFVVKFRLLYIKKK